MSSIGSKALYVASAAVFACTLALTLPLAAAPSADSQGASAPTSKDDHSMPGNAEGMSSLMQQNGAMRAMQQGGMGGMQHGGMNMMQHGGNMDMMQHHQEMMATLHSMHGGAPTLPGQDAFGAIGEIVAMLESDPKTDWSKIDLEALRQHLIDMNEVTLDAAAAPKPIDGGIQIAITGTGRTLGAIQRMVPMHAAEIDGQKGWSAKTSALPDGVLLTVTATDPKEVAHIRGLGFAGIMVEGSHHQAHHLAIAKGEPMHAAGADHTQHVH
jgi:hypothetical protein